MIPKHLTRSLCLLLLIFSSALSQTPSSQADEQRKAQKELEQKALSLLDDVIKDAGSFKQIENRIRIKAVAANILWKYDEARARIIFREAMASLVDVLKDQMVSNPEEAQRMFEGPKELRGEMLLMLARHDPRLARELLRATRAPASQAGGAQDQGVYFDLQTDLNLATQIASSDPKLATEIAEESLANELPYQLPNLIDSIREKDPEAAAHLASEVMTKLRSEKLESNRAARSVAINLLQIATQNNNTEIEGGTKSGPSLLDQAALRDLTEMVAAEALRSPSQNADLLMSLRGMMPVVEKYAPSRATQLQSSGGPTKGITVNDELEPNWSRYQSLIDKGSVDEILAAAKNATGQASNVLYMQAATKLAEKGDAQRAREVINDNIKDPNMRRMFLEQIDRRAAETVAAEGQIEEARKILATLRTNEERVMLLAQLAGGAAAKGEKKIALQLLDEARALIGQRAKNINQLGAQLAVARGYAQLDPSRSLAILEPIVDQLNELLGAAIVLGGFFVDELVKDDEVMLGPFAMLFNLASNEFISQYVADITALARADFNRTRALVERFQRDEVRAMMRLLLAESVLSPPAPNSPGVKAGERTNGVIIGGQVGGVVIEKDVP